MVIFGILLCVIVSVIRHAKLPNSKIPKIVHVKKCLIGKLVLACKYVILNTAETSLDDKQITCEKVIPLYTQFHW